jgi:delta-aminolevulinic acid dehydratase/porphobilinogen synthase
MWSPSGWHISICSLIQTRTTAGMDIQSPKTTLTGEVSMLASALQQDEYILTKIIKNFKTSFAANKSN